VPVSILNRWNGSVIATVEDTDDLREAVIRLVRKGVSLRAANLSAANLNAADLRDADRSGADLDPIKNDFFAVLSYAPAEVPALIAALDAGRVNGSCYTDGECGCLIGTLSIASGNKPSDEMACAAVHGLSGNSSRPAECFFLPIGKGSTPENNQHAKLARDWAAEWLTRMQLAFSTKEPATQPA